MNAFPALVKSIVEEVKLPTPKQQGQKSAVARPPAQAAPASPQPKPPVTPAAVIIKKPAAPPASKEIVIFFGSFSLSLSRAIVFNALVRSYAAQKEKVFVVSAKQWLPTLRWMWGDLKNLEVVGIGSIEGGEKMLQALYAAKKDTLTLGENSLAWDRLAYERAGVPFNDRWDRFSVGGFSMLNASSGMTPPAIPPSQSPRYALIHDDAERGWHIRKELLPRGGLKHIRIDKSHPNLFAWQTLIENATEIHCVPSAVAVLADSIPTKGKLILHKYAKPNRVEPLYKKQWGVLA